jgi:outer membrane protein OmpA-like peptidoglycan-associated protein
MNPMIRAALHAALGGLFLLVTMILVIIWVVSARGRLAENEAAALSSEEPQVAVASAADEGYCSAELKKVLRRVLQSCGLLSSGEVRGCQPLEAKSVATMSGDDFNSLFLPLAERAGILQFDLASDSLDETDTQLLDAVFADQRGGSYFFVVSRSSPDGDQVTNRKLSERRGQVVLEHLRETFKDPDLEKEVGLLWLGEEFAQLDEGFCDWKRSGAEGCDPNELNRSAFVAWIDCRL